MKKTITLAITFVCLLAQTTFGQQPYRSLKACGNDTAKYLRYNFKERGNNNLYQGKTLAQLLSDLDIKPIGVVRTMTTLSDNGTSYITGISLFFTQIHKSGFSELRDENLSITWGTPILQENSATQTKAKLSPPAKGQKKYTSGHELFTAYPQKEWIPQFYDFFKDQKIKTIYYCPARY